MSKTKVTTEIEKILRSEEQSLLARGLQRGLLLYQNIEATERKELDFYAGNSTTRNLFSCLCRGIEIEIDQSSDLLFKYRRMKKTSSKYIEIYNVNTLIHLYNEKTRNPSNMPVYITDKFDMNKTFRAGKQNYIVLSFIDDDDNIPKFGFVVYDSKGLEVYRQPFDVSLFGDTVNATA